MDLGLRGKKAVWTDGSRGIGRPIAVALAEQGVSVAACYQRESDAVRSLADELSRFENDSHVVQADVSDPEAVARLAGDVRARLARVDVLVNNAGVVSHATLDKMELSEWQRIIHTNLTGLFLVTQAVLDLIPDGGSIINVTS